MKLLDLNSLNLSPVMLRTGPNEGILIFLVV